MASGADQRGAARRGLGKDLAEIIAAVPPGSTHLAPSEVRQPDVDDVITASLDALAVVVRSDVVGYVHAADGFAPELHLRRTGGARIDDAVAFDLLRRTTALLAEEPGAVPLALPGLEALAVVTAGVRSRGVHLVGRDAPPYAPAEATRVVRTARALGNAAHTVEAAVARF